MTITKITKETYEINEKRLKEIIDEMIACTHSFPCGSKEFVKAITHKAIIEYRIWHDETYKQLIPPYHYITDPMKAYINEYLATLVP